MWEWTWLESTKRILLVDDRRLKVINLMTATVIFLVNVATWNYWISKAQIWPLLSYQSPNDHHWTHKSRLLMPYSEKPFDVIWYFSCPLPIHISTLFKYFVFRHVRVALQRGKKRFLHPLLPGIVRAINVIRKLIRYKWIEFQVRPIGKKLIEGCDVTCEWQHRTTSFLRCHDVTFVKITFYVIALFENCQLWLNFLLIFNLILFL